MTQVIDFIRFPLKKKISENKLLNIKNFILKKTRILKKLII